jgi:phage baseplate assembly protein W|tara:strand:- start:6175 stop:6594 length:420 start_codon:yes stop_codon:yes gene_type:complete
MALKDIGNNELRRSRRFDDLLISMKKNAFTDDVSVVKNDNAIKQSIKNLVLTNPGEKHFQPLVGSRVFNLLFEPLDAFTADAVKDEVINTINQYEPRVELTDVVVVPIDEGNKLSITIEYRIVGLPVVETIDFVLQRPE